ncbi:MAG: hypothetical protein ABIA04_04885 [Pseudomonadota bacterium]
MARRKTPKSLQTVHITKRCINRQYLLNPKENWNEIVSWLNCLHLFFNILLHHVLVLGNHLHIICTPMEDNIGNAMGYTFSNLARYLNYKNNRINQIFGTRYFPTVIKDDEHLITTIRYLYQNPLRAGIINNPFSYKYSSLGFYFGCNSDGLIVTPDNVTNSLIRKDQYGFDTFEKLIQDQLLEENLSKIRKALRKSEFKFNQDYYENSKK